MEQQNIHWSPAMPGTENYIPIAPGQPHSLLWELLPEPEAESVRLGKIIGDRTVIAYRITVKCGYWAVEAAFDVPRCVDPQKEAEGQEEERCEDCGALVEDCICCSEDACPDCQWPLNECQCDPD